VRSARLWARLLGVEQAVVERVVFHDDAEAIVVAVRPRRGVKRRFGKCGRRCPGFDQGQGRRHWRALDLGVVRAYLEAEAPRVCCPEHGVVVAAVPWRATALHTPAFVDTAAWLAVPTSKQAVGELLRGGLGDGRAASSPASSPTPRPVETASPGCGGSASTRSRTRGATGT
jgi:transposase